MYGIAFIGKMMIVHTAKVILIYEVSSYEDQ